MALGIGRGKLVGEVYVLARADGSLMEADLRKSAAAAGKAAGGESEEAFAAEWKRKWDEDRLEFEKATSETFRRMGASKNWRPFLNQFEKTEDASASLRKSLDQLVESGPWSDKMRKDVLASFDEYVKSYEKQQDRVRKLGEQAEKTNRSLDKVMGDERIAAAKRFTRELARARNEGDFSVMQRRGEKYADTIERVKNDMKEYAQYASITRDTQRTINKELDAWGREQAEIVRASKTELQLRKESYSEAKKGFDEAKAYEKEKYRLAVAANREYRESIGLSQEEARRRYQLARRAHEYAKAQSAEKRRLYREEFNQLNRLIKREERIVEVAKGTSKVRRDNDRDLKRSSSTLRRILFDEDKTLTRIYGGFGRAGGRGARNDFINALGIGVQLVAKNIGNLITLAPRLAFNLKDIGQAFRGVGAAFQAGGLRAGIPALLKSFGTLGRTMFGPQGIIAALAAAAGSILILGKVIPGAVSAVLGLAGGIGAVLAVAINGLAAAAVTAVPVIAGLGAQIGALGIATYKWAQTDRAQALFKSWNKEISNIVEYLFPELEAMFGLLRRGTNSLLTPIIKNLDESLENLIVNLGGTVDGIAAKRGPTQTALRQWKKTIVAVSKDFGDAFSNFTIGLINFFRPILPYAEEFSQYIADGAKAFKEWTLGAGQKDIKQWIDGAVVALKETWGLLGDIGGLIIDVFFSGGAQDAGKSLIRSLRDWIQDIRDYLAENPDALREWFADARRITEDVGELAVSIGGIISELNSDEARNSGQELLGAITSITDAIKTMASYTDKLSLIADYVILIVGSLFKLGTGDTVGAYEFALEKIGQIAAKQAKITSDEIKAQIKEADKQLRELTFEDYKIPVSVTANTKQFEKITQAVEDYKLTGKTIPVDGNVGLWNKVKGTVLGFVFDPKTVPVYAEDSYWKNSKRFIEQYEFPKKYIPVDVNKPTLAELYAIRSYISENLSATAKVRVILPDLPNGSQMTGGGVTFGSAAGRIATQPTKVLIGEAGPEAVVPLARNLNQVDASVRQLSAIAQGKALPMAAGGVRGGSSKSVTVEEGAVTVVTAATSPNVVGSIVLDGIADALASAV